MFVFHSAAHGLSFAAFHYPDLSALDFSQSKYPVVSSRILISNKCIFSLLGTDVHGMEVSWRIPLRHVGSVIVRGRTVILVDQSVGAVCDITLPSLEEAFVVYVEFVHSLIFIFSLFCFFKLL